MLKCVLVCVDVMSCPCQRCTVLSLTCLQGVFHNRHCRNRDVVKRLLFPPTHGQ